MRSATSAASSSPRSAVSAVKPTRSMKRNVCVSLGKATSHTAENPDTREYTRPNCVEAAWKPQLPASDPRRPGKPTESLLRARAGPRLLPVPLDGVGVARLGLIGVHAGVPEGPPLAQQVPT